jgi:hypothetical protein
MSISRSTVFELTAAVTLLIFAASARAGTMFFDDFEDEIAGNAPAVVTTSQGPGDAADVGLSWTLDTGGPVAPFVDGSGHLDLGRSSANGATDSAAIAHFMPGPLEGTTVNLDYFLDRTPSGTTSVNIYGEGDGGRSFRIRIQRGNDMRLYSYDDGVETQIFDLNNDDEWRHMSLVLGPSTFDISVSQLDGDPAPFTATGLGYDNAVDPTTLTSIRFEDNANNNAREFLVDNLAVSNGVPEPGTGLLLGLGMGLGAVAMLRRRKGRCRTEGPDAN